MEKLSFLLLALLSFFSTPTIVMCDLQRQTYIIQVEKPIQSSDDESLKFWHNSFLPESDNESGRLLHSYSEVFGGFAAKLTEEELEKLSEKKGFVRAFPNRVLSALTTHTPDFLGLRLGRGLWKASNLGKGIIIGVLDTGVTPGHPSFDDKGMPPPPAKWKGSCHLQSGCNNKLIGALSMTKNNAVDLAGHGTHTSATAAGNFVRNVNIYGLACGTAAGIAPRAHLAMYQVCHQDGSCELADVLAGLDTAVKDGVDVLSISLGSSSTPLDEDLLAIGAFGAMEKGVFVSCAGGNDGPRESSISNEAPWILTVAATTIDRSLRATVKLGNGDVILGESLDQSSSFTNGPLPLYYSATDSFCYSPHPKHVKGKVVLCESSDSSSTAAAALLVKMAGGAAMIYIDPSQFGSNRFETRTDFPTARVSSTDGSKLKTYVASSRKPTASILFNGTIFGADPAPTVAFFSSRGPSLATPRIMKPDISGPGANILAAYIPIDGNGTMVLNSTFRFLSGTSMATPHLSGVAALIKSVHPKWSPAAIKSAIITTSKNRGINRKPIEDEQGKRASFFDMGAGHVNAPKAVDPGLVYDLGVDEYIGYVCGKFGSAGAKAIIRDKSVNCSKVKKISESDLNHPSILLVPQNGSVATTMRTVTNVGPAKSTYKVGVQMPKMASVLISPKTLVFSQVNEKKTFSVSAKWTGSPPSGSVFVAGNLRWISDKHVVRSPIIISTTTTD